MIHLSQKERYLKESDESLWNKFSQGDLKALEVVYDRYFYVLIRYGLSLCGSEELTEECIQDMFTVFIARPEIPDVTYVRSYLMKTLYNGLLGDEMCFFKKNKEKKLDQQLLNVFTDLTCSALKPDVTTQAINALPNYFIRLAEALQSNTYDEWEKEFRIRNYAAYSNVEEWAEKLMTKKYGNLDNFTGISVNEGDEIIVLEGDTHKQAISLQCIGEETVTSDKGDYLQVASSGDTYPLESGVNKITIRNSGQLFVMYNTDITSPTASPITIHIPLGSGKVTGFFDLKEHKTDAKYAQLLSKATHKYFCVRGDKIMFYFHTADMRSVVEKQILSAINLWDDIISWQQELMGIENVRPREVNNPIFAISPEGSYMWASNYRIAFVHTYLKNILLKENVMADRDNAWGPAHEIGHIHQSAIN